MDENCCKSAAAEESAEVNTATIAASADSTAEMNYPSAADVAAALGEAATRAAGIGLDWSTGAFPFRENSFCEKNLCETMAAHECKSCPELEDFPGARIHRSVGIGTRGCRRFVSDVLGSGTDQLLSSFSESRAMRWCITSTNVNVKPPSPTRKIQLPIKEIISFAQLKQRIIESSRGANSIYDPVKDSYLGRLVTEYVGKKHQEFANIRVTHTDEEFFTFCSCPKCLEYREIVLQLMDDQLKARSMWEIFVVAVSRSYQPMLKNGTALAKYDKLQEAGDELSWLTCGYLYNTKTQHLNFIFDQTLTENMIFVLFSAILLVDNPHLLLQLLAFQIECVVKAYAEGFLEIVEPNNRKIPAEEMLNYILDGYDELCRISEHLSSFLFAFESDFLRRFGLTWTLLNARMYQQHVYLNLTDTMLACIITLKEDDLTDKHAALIKKYIQFDDEMLYIDKRWTDTWIELNKFNLSETESNRRKRMIAISRLFELIPKDALELNAIDSEYIDITEWSTHENRQLVWQNLMAYTFRTWPDSYSAPLNNLIRDDKCKNCSVMLEYHMDSCKCVTCSIAGGPQPPKRHPDNTCVKCLALSLVEKEVSLYESKILNVCASDDFISFLKSKDKRKANSLEDLSDCSSLSMFEDNYVDPDDIGTYHLSWALFRHLNDRKRYIFPRIDEQYFCFNCKRQSCLLARKILNNEIAYALSLHLVRYYQPLTMSRDELRAMLPNIMLYNRKMVSSTIGLDPQLDDVVVKIYWTFVISVFASYFVEFNYECPLHLEHFELVGNDIKFNNERITGNKDDTKFVQFLDKIKALAVEKGDENGSEYPSDATGKDSPDRELIQKKMVEEYLKMYNEDNEAIPPVPEEDVLQTPPECDAVSITESVNPSETGGKRSSGSGVKEKSKKCCFDHSDLGDHCKENHSSKKRIKKECNHARMNETRERLRKKLSQLVNSRNNMKPPTAAKQPQAAQQQSTKQNSQQQQQKGTPTTNNTAVPTVTATAQAGTSTINAVQAEKNLNDDDDSLECLNTLCKRISHLHTKANSTSSSATAAGAVSGSAGAGSGGAAASVSTATENAAKAAARRCAAAVAAATSDAIAKKTPAQRELDTPSRKKNVSVRSTTISSSSVATSTPESPGAVEEVGPALCIANDNDAARHCAVAVAGAPNDTIAKKTPTQREQDTPSRKKNASARSTTTSVSSASTSTSKSTSASGGSSGDDAGIEVVKEIGSEKAKQIYELLGMYSKDQTKVKKWINETLSFIEGSNDTKNPVNAKKAAKRAKQKQRKEEIKRIAELQDFRAQFHDIYFKEFFAKIQLKETKSMKKRDKRKITDLEVNLKKLGRAKAKLEGSILELIAIVKQTNSDFKFAYLPTKEQQIEKLQGTHPGGVGAGNHTLPAATAAAAQPLVIPSATSSSASTLPLSHPSTQVTNNLNNGAAAAANYSLPYAHANNFPYPSAANASSDMQPPPCVMPRLLSSSNVQMCYAPNQPNDIATDPSKRIVTIRRVNLPNVPEPQVTVTAKGASPDKDKLLYTFVNGQLVQTTNSYAAAADSPMSPQQQQQQPHVYMKAAAHPPPPLSKTQLKKERKRAKKLAEAAAEEEAERQRLIREKEDLKRRELEAATAKRDTKNQSKQFKSKHLLPTNPQKLQQIPPQQMQENAKQNSSVAKPDDIKKREQQVITTNSGTTTQSSKSNKKYPTAMISSSASTTSVSTSGSISSKKSTSSTTSSASCSSASSSTTSSSSSDSVGSCSQVNTRDNSVCSQRLMEDQRRQPQQQEHQPKVSSKKTATSPVTIAPPPPATPTAAPSAKKDNTKRQKFIDNGQFDNNQFKMLHLNDFVSDSDAESDAEEQTTEEEDAPADSSKPSIGLQASVAVVNSNLPLKQTPIIPENKKPVNAIVVVPPTVKKVPAIVATTSVTSKKEPYPPQYATKQQNTQQKPPPPLPLNKASSPTVSSNRTTSNKSQDRRSKTSSYAIQNQSGRSTKAGSHATEKQQQNIPAAVSSRDSYKRDSHRTAVSGTAQKSVSNSNNNSNNNNNSKLNNNRNESKYNNNNKTNNRSNTANTPNNSNRNSDRNQPRSVAAESNCPHVGSSQPSRRSQKNSSRNKGRNHHQQQKQNNNNTNNSGSGSGCGGIAGGNVYGKSNRSSGSASAGQQSQQQQQHSSDYNNLHQSMQGMRITGSSYHASSSTASSHHHHYGGSANDRHYPPTVSSVAPRQSTHFSTAVSSSNVSIMDQLSRGVQVENLSLPPGITLTKVDPSKSEQLRAKSESIQKLSKPLQHQSGMAGSHHPPGATIIASGYYNSPSYGGAADQQGGVIMVETMAKPPPQSQQNQHYHGKSSTESGSGQNPSKTSKNKKRKNRMKPSDGSRNSGAALNSATGGSKMVTLRNPMFHGGGPAIVQQQQSQPHQQQGAASATVLSRCGTVLPQQNRTAMPIAPLPMDQPAAIIKNENGMFTIRNPALQQAVANGLSIGGYRQFNANYYTPQEIAAVNSPGAVNAIPSSSSSSSATVVPPSINNNNSFSYFSNNNINDHSPASASAVTNAASTDNYGNSSTVAANNNNNNQTAAIISSMNGSTSGGLIGAPNFLSDLGIVGGSSQSQQQQQQSPPHPPKCLSAIGSEVKNAQQQKKSKENQWTNFGQELTAATSAVQESLTCGSFLGSINSSPIQEKYQQSNYYNGFDVFPSVTSGNQQMSAGGVRTNTNSLFDASDCHMHHNCDDSPPPTITGFNHYLDGIPNTGVIRYDDAAFLKTLMPGQNLNNEVSIHNVNDSNFTRNASSPVAHRVEITPVYANRPTSANMYECSNTARQQQQYTGSLNVKNYSEHLGEFINENLFTPNNLLNLNDLDLGDRDVESFKRFSYDFEPPKEKQKVNININDLLIKKSSRTSPYLDETSLDSFVQNINSLKISGEQCSQLNGSLNNSGNSSANGWW